ncbi:acetylglutamate kinase [Pseudotenacibaculum haliotis]|uniref:Acetylglutamate kinase n=1 Tax=Pseudotenacibaculum haliotis TaxID=1862138 RepID=A0ABW5LVN0_9FLAO
MKKQQLKIVKIGGNIIDDEVVLKEFLSSFAQLKGPKILVHGGGKLATRLAEKMNIPVKMIDGRRITDAETLELITMVYAGKINKNIVAQLQANQCNTIGFSGADGNTIIAKKRPVKQIDYGFVGDIVKVEVNVINVLLINNLTISFCAISHDAKGQLLNTNADTIASELSIALSKDYEVALYYCFEKNGVLKNVEDSDSVIEEINTKQYQQLKKDGIIYEGMIPKLDNCFYALSKGVQHIKIGKAEMLFNTNTKHTTVRK